MRINGLPALAGALAAGLGLTGCAEVVTTLAMVSDQMAAEQGVWYDDVHLSEMHGGGACPIRIDLGMVNNQTYVRPVNLGSGRADVTVVWNTGFESPFSLGGGEAGNFVYMSPSIEPSRVDVRCYAE